MSKFLLSDSCLTIALRRNQLFVSAFPGLIVFGEVSTTYFKQLKYFEFSYYDIFELFRALTQIIQYLVVNSDTLNQDRGIIISKCDNEIYFWMGKTIILNQKEVKIITLGIEIESNIVFELTFDCEKLNDLIYGLYTCMLASLCLKKIEKKLFECIIEENIEKIVSLKFKDNCENFVQQFIKDHKIDINSITESNLVESLFYYHESIVVLYKLKSLFKVDLFHSVETILS